MHFTINPCANDNINGVYQLFPQNKLSWRELVLDLTKKFSVNLSYCSKVHH